MITMNIFLKDHNWYVIPFVIVAAVFVVVVVQVAVVVAAAVGVGKLHPGIHHLSAAVVGKMLESRKDKIKHFSN